MAQSLWLDHSRMPSYEGSVGSERFDVVVVGGGLTGLTTALLCSRAGQRVAVLEARHVGAGTTGNTTAKVSLLQGTRLSTLAGKNPASLLRAYVGANSAGQQWLLNYCAERGVAVQTRPAVTYGTTPDGENRARAELACAVDAGMPAAWESDLDLPFPTRGGVVLPDQAQLDPMELLAALAADVVAAGGVVAEATRVRDVRVRRDGCTVITEHGRVSAERVVLATGVPVLDRGGYFARLEPQRSYAAAFAVPGPLPAGMYLSADAPTRSLRGAPTADGELLLVGGNGHGVGRHPSPLSLVDELPRPSSPEHVARTGGPHRTTSRSTGCPSSDRCCPAVNRSCSRPGTTSGG